jgi:hypothetical protein
MEYLNEMRHVIMDLTTEKIMNVLKVVRFSILIILIVEIKKLILMKTVLIVLLTYDYVLEVVETRK